MTAFKKQKKQIIIGITINWGCMDRQEIFLSILSFKKAVSKEPIFITSTTDE
jgi:hypothetical protein